MFELGAVMSQGRCSGFLKFLVKVESEKWKSGQ
jgi:hypothetical protein